MNVKLMMEFNYRATDHRTPFTVTPSPNFSAGDMGRSFNGSHHLEGPNSAIEMSQFIWREMEKVKIREEIREEIIVDEIVRRRLLEADVRRQLSVERELALQGGGEFFIGPRGFPAPLLPSELEGRPLGQTSTTSLHGRLGMSSLFTRESGGLRTVLQMNAEPHILLGKPQLGNGIQKEKIVLPAKPVQDVNVCALSFARSENRQLREVWSCALCHFTASCEQGLNVHLKEKIHKAKEAGLRKKGNKFNIGWFTEKTTSVSSKGSPSMCSKLLKKRDQHIAKSAELGSPSQDPNNVKGKDYSFDESQKNNEATVGVRKNSTSNKNNALKITFEACEGGVNTLKNTKEHSAGEKHLPQLQKGHQNTQAMQVVQKLTVSKKDSHDLENNASQDLSTAVPKVELEGQQEEEDASAVHKVELDGQQEKEVNIDFNSEKCGDPLITRQRLGNSVRNSVAPIARIQENKKNVLRFWCEMCQVGTDTKKVMEIHRTGKKHLANKKLKFRFWCDVCQIGTDTEKMMEFHRAGKKHHSQLPEINQNPGNEPPNISMQRITGAEANSLDTKHRQYLIKNPSQFSDVCMKKNEAPVRRLKESQVQVLKKNSSKFWCDMCHVGAVSKEEMAAHWYGRKHQKIIKSLVGKAPTSNQSQ